MKLTQIKLTNWCQYEGSHPFDLGDDPKKNVVLIHADNDVGKSSLFYSIAWCLYKEQPQKWKANKWPLYPLQWFNRAEIGSDIKTEVSIEFDHEGARFSITRSFVTKKTAHGSGSVETDSYFGLQRRAEGGNWVRDSEDKLNRILPKSVLGYFIFDAEEVEHFAVNSDKVRQSVLRLLDIEDGERAIQHLQTVSKDLRKAFEQKKSTKAIDLDQEISEVEDAIERCRMKLENPESGLRAQLNSAKSERHEIDDHLFKYQGAHDLLDEERRIKDDIDKNSADSVSALKKIKNVTQNMYVNISLPTVRWSLQYLEDKRQRGELPKHVKRQFVEDRIRLGECICGTALMPGSIAHNKISSFRDTLSDSLGERSQELNSGLVRLIEKSESQRGQIAILLTHLADMKARKRELDEQLRVTRSKIQQRDDIPEVPKLQLKKEQLENREYSLVRDITQVEDELREKTTKLEALNHDYARELNKEEERTVVEREWQLATKVQDALTRAVGHFKSKAREYLEAQANIVGAELFWREGVYTIKINDDYALSVYSPEYGNRDLLAGLSMGATQMTGLALIAALAKQTKAQAPLIMDTPFARLSPAHITRALSQCPDYFQQWILFLQPSEWRDSDYRSVVGHRVQKEFTLVRDNSTGVTRPVEGYQKEYFGKSRGAK